MPAQNLRIPGPVPMPEGVRAALANQMINHRGSEFKVLLTDVRTRLAGVFATQNEILCFTSSGTGGLEAAVVNLFSPGDRGLFVVGGVFGERAAAIAQAFGVNVVRLEHPWGTACSPVALRDALRAHPDVKVVYLTHNETSTGVTNPIARLAAVIHEESKALIMVDAISGLGALPFETDGWGIDVVVSASQKAFACPPGLSMISVSPKAWEVAAHSRMPRFYWDFQKLREAHNEGSTPYTPAVSVFYGLSAALDQMENEGASARFARHARAGDLVRNGVLDLGLGLFADPPHNSNVVTAITLPEGISPKDVRDELRLRYNTIVAGGQDRLKDSIIRIGHLGFFTEKELTTTLEQLDAVVKSLRR
ncbi:MAG: alanine--glyoxylate aminotransferase family protein [Kouleothrix sp.]|nr:alanine--glyoxylate aminotransferase family protein [Kouleothrix sp.]